MGNVLIIDGYNMIHRCRFSWGGGPADIGDTFVLYNFFRVFRSTIDEFKFSKVYFAIEGGLSNRQSVSSDYKANRSKDVESLSDEEISYWNSFAVQKKIIIECLRQYFPVTVARHPGYEADDLIFNLCKHHHKDDEVTIVSSDTDFIQAINLDPDRIKLWNPISKSYRPPTTYDYVDWKSMVGDKSDNISGVPRVGKKTAEKILNTPGELERRLLDESFSRHFLRSKELIKFADFGEIHNSFDITEFSSPKKLWHEVRLLFNEFNFKFSFDENKWDDYYKTFDHLWYNYDIGDI